jgi:hypothetical protein
LIAWGRHTCSPRCGGRCRKRHWR